MKRIFTILAVAMVLILTIVPAFASSGDEGSAATPVYVPVTVTVEDNTPVVVMGTDSANSFRTAFASAVVSIFGEYTPLTQTVTTYMADGTAVQSVQYVSGVAGLDWVWLASVVLFGIVLYCIFRMIGGILKWK